MALYRFEVGIVRAGSRASGIVAHHKGGGGAVGCYRYMSQSQEQERSHERPVRWCEGFGPDGILLDPGVFCLSVDYFPNRDGAENCVIGFDVHFAVPHELSESSRDAIGRSWARGIADSYGVGVVIAPHEPETRWRKINGIEYNLGTDERNFHFHAFISARTVNQDATIGNVQRALNPMCFKKDNKPVVFQRQLLADVTNEALERSGLEERVSHLSYKAQGIDIEPGKHRGYIETRRMRSEQKMNLQKIPDIQRSLDVIKISAHKRIKESTKRIQEIQDSRRVGIDSHIGANLGSIEAWVNDAVGTFMRVNASLDRAERLRKQIREIERRHFIMRDATKEETDELKMLGRWRDRAEKQIARVERISHGVSQLPQAVRIDINAKQTEQKRWLSQLDRSINQHQAAMHAIKGSQTISW